MLVLSSPLPLPTNDFGLSFAGNKKSVRATRHSLVSTSMLSLHFVHLSTGQSTWLPFTNYVSQRRLLNFSVPRQRNGGDRSAPEFTKLL